MRPKSITMFDRLFLGSLVLGIVNYVVAYDTIMAQITADPALAASGLAGPGFIIATAIFSYAISLLLWFLISRKASTIAKWVLVVMSAFGLLFLPSSLASAPMLEAVLAGTVTAMQIAAIIFLFMRDARDWFANKGRSDMSAATFE
jgi:hypothetical protein